MAYDMSIAQWHRMCGVPYSLHMRGEWREADKETSLPSLFTAVGFGTFRSTQTTLELQI